MSLSLPLCLSVFLTVLGSWQFGYHTGVLNAPQNVIEEFIEQVYKERNNGVQISKSLLSFLWSVIVSSFAFAGIFGGLLGGKAANLLGRRNALAVNSLVIACGISVMMSSKQLRSYNTLITGRLIIGFSSGLYTILVPMFLSEIASVSQRGAIGAINQLGVTVGLLSSQILGLEEILGGPSTWSWLIGLTLGPALAQLVSLPFCPESPRYLLDRNREQESRAALTTLRAASADEIEAEIAEMKAAIDANEGHREVSLIDLFKSHALRASLIVGVVMQLSQQLSGINAVFNYSTSIFMSAGLIGYNAKLATVGVGIVMVVMTMVSIPLMESLGRRVLHLSGLAGMLVAAMVLTLALLTQSSIDGMKYMSVASALAYVMFFAIGPGTVPWLFISEIFTQGPRPAAMSVAVFVNWAANFSVSLTFPFIQALLGDFSFLPFIALLALFLLFCYKRMPETKNRTFEEIAALFQTNAPVTTYGS